MKKKVGLIFMVVGAVFLVVGYYLVKKADSVKKWPSVKGVVVQSKVVSHLDSESNQTMYSPSITYRYTVNGKEFTSSSYAFVSSSSSRPDFAEKVVSSYPSGKQVVVFYNPENPYKAVLTRNSTKLIYIPHVMGGIFLLLGIALFLF